MVSGTIGFQALSRREQTVTVCTMLHRSLKRIDAFIFGYTRSRDTGEVTNYHRKDIANTIHGSTGAGGNTDQFAAIVYETKQNNSDWECVGFKAERNGL